VIKLHELFDTTDIPEIQHYKDGSYDIYEFSIKSMDDRIIEYEVQFRNIGARELGLIDGVNKNERGADISFLAKIKGSKKQSSFDQIGIAPSIRVFSIIARIIQGVIKQNNYAGFRFDANKSEGSRKKLYDRFAELIEEKTNYDWFKEDERESGEYLSYMFLRRDISDKI